MDWIERWFNVSPDAGDGSLELLISIVLGIAIVAFLWKFQRTRRLIALAGTTVMFGRVASKRRMRWAGRRPRVGSALDAPWRQHAARFTSK